MSAEPLVRAPWLKSLKAAAVTTAFLDAGGASDFAPLVIDHLAPLLTVIEDDDGELRVVARDRQPIGAMIGRLKTERPRLFSG